LVSSLVMVHPPVDKSVPIWTLEMEAAEHGRPTSLPERQVARTERERMEWGFSVEMIYEHLPTSDISPQMAFATTDVCRVKAGG